MLYTGEDINGKACLHVRIIFLKLHILIAKKSTLSAPRILQATVWFWSAMPDVQSPWWDVWADLTSAEMKESGLAT